MKDPYPTKKWCRQNAMPVKDRPKELSYEGYKKLGYRGSKEFIDEVNKLPF